MAGDIGIDEQVVINLPPHQPEAQLAMARAGRHGPMAIHTYGRVAVVANHEAGGPGSALLGAPVAEATDLSDLERLGLAAFRLRESEEYMAAKAERPRDGEDWDMPGCGHFGLPGPAAVSGLGPAGGPGAPTSSYLEGTVAVGIVIVEGPNDDLKFSDIERTKVVAEVQNGLSWYAAGNPAAGISFSYDIRDVTVGVQPDPSAADLEALWRDPAMASLGFTGDWNGVLSYVEDNRSRLGTQWTYCIFFTKYPLSHFAYAAIGGPRIVMNYDNDGWGPDNIDRVVTHESGHIFGCPDEYAESGCDCGGSWGRYGVANKNCQNCAPGGGVSCIMKRNDFALCHWTPSHLGWGHGVRGNPVLRQGRFGRQGNFELVAPSEFDGIVFLWRNNDDPGMPWSGPWVFGQDLGPVDDLTMIQSNYGSPGNLELIARVGDTLQFFWRDSGPAFQWNGPFQIGAGAAGTPVLVQSRFGRQGNFELAYPAVGGGIGFMWRNNDDPAMPWSGAGVFGQNAGQVSDLTMIQSNYGSPGNMELIARVGDTLQFFWRDSGPAFQWNGPFQIGAGAAGNPVLIQSRFGRQGNFELAYPAVGGGIGFMWRNNDDPAMPWSGAGVFGGGSSYDALSMIQSNYGNPGNLEIIARAGDTLQFFWRDSGPAFNWNGPWRIL